MQKQKISKFSKIQVTPIAIRKSNNSSSNKESDTEFIEQVKKKQAALREEIQDPQIQKGMLIATDEEMQKLIKLGYQNIMHLKEYHVYLLQKNQEGNFKIIHKSFFKSLRLKNRQLKERYFCHREQLRKKPKRGNKKILVALYKIMGNSVPLMITSSSTYSVARTPIQRRSISSILQSYFRTSPPVKIASATRKSGLINNESNAQESHVEINTEIVPQNNNNPEFQMSLRKRTRDMLIDESNYMKECSNQYDIIYQFEQNSSATRRPQKARKPNNYQQNQGFYILNTQLSNISPGKWTSVNSSTKPQVRGANSALSQNDQRTKTRTMKKNEGPQNAIRVSLTQQNGENFEYLLTDYNGSPQEQLMQLASHLKDQQNQFQQQQPQKPEQQ
ncbi:UNKNOWN [Stylonychia lemnae]|uniref:Uncharacterized protein n=1 Tax=Stylonychia lemnae TaxID=5949 RepID=A0A077ZUB7_STYLE|nr:UNKNOWN [Stylonychia lemnae]|eukprot:CDW72885.1 UNKNOWN [Stylonychia lemnae]